MKPRSTLLLAWLLTGVAAVGGSILGNAAGQRGLFVGAVLGGILGVVASVMAATQYGWLAVSQRRNAIVGGLVGLAVAAPIAVLNLHTPAVPVASCALVGVGVLFGAGVGSRS